MRRRIPYLLALATAAACGSHDAKPEALDEARLAPLFDALGDRAAADLRAAAAQPHRSRLAIAEAIAMTTPAGFFHYAPALRDFHVAPADLFAFADAHPDGWERLAARMLAREHDALTALQQSVAALPATDPDDCAELGVRVEALQRSTGPDHGLAAVLAPSLAPCAP